MTLLARMAQDPTNTLVAHIMPSEAAALKKKNGGGSINPITGLPEFWSDGGGDDSDSRGGERRGGDDSDDNDSMADSREARGSWGDVNDGLSNVDATRAKEAYADMLSGPAAMADTANRAAWGEIASDEQARQDRVSGMWGGAKEFRDYPNETRLERGWNRLTRADNVVAGLLGLAGTATGIPGLGFGLSKLGGYLAKNITPASTVANLSRTKGYVGAGYPGMLGPVDRNYAPSGLAGADPTRVAGYNAVAGGLTGASDSGGYGGESPTYDPEEAKRYDEEKKKRDEETKKKREQVQAILAKVLGFDLEGIGEQKNAQQIGLTGWPSYT